MKIDYSKKSFQNSKEYNLLKSIYDEGFKARGFPNKQNEDWKFSDLNTILNTNFKKLSILDDKYKYKTDFKLKFDHIPIYIFNGVINISDKLNLVKGLKINFNNGLKNHSAFKFDNSSSISPEFIKKMKSDPMLSLNVPFYNGFELAITKDLKKPIVFYDCFNGNLNDKVINISNKIKISNCNSTIIHYQLDLSKSSFFINSFQSIELFNSKLDYFSVNSKKSEIYKYSKNNIKVNKSELNSFIFTSDMRFKKEDLDIDLEEKSSVKVLSGVCLRKNEHQEIKVNLKHLTPNCKSYQKIKKILRNKSKGIFQGKIYVSDIAQKTDAYQLSKGLILEEDAEFSSKPELEIYADDVKCSHGSTSGNVDEDTIYYLMTRGLSRKESLKILVRGFLNDLILEIKDKDIKNIITNHLDDKINYEN